MYIHIYIIFCRNNNNGIDNIIVQTELAQETKVKLAKPYGNGAHVSVPKEWLGKKIQVTLLYEPSNEKCEEKE